MHAYVYVCVYMCTFIYVYMVSCVYASKYARMHASAGWNISHACVEHVDCIMFITIGDPLARVQTLHTYINMHHNLHKICICYLTTNIRLRVCIREAVPQLSGAIELHSCVILCV